MNLVRRVYGKLSYFGGVSSDKTHVDRPQNGESSHVLPGSTVAQRVEAKHIPGKSKLKKKNCLEKVDLNEKLQVCELGREWRGLC